MSSRKLKLRQFVDQAMAYGRLPAVALPACLVFLLQAVALPARAAEEYPARPITLINASTPGAGGDITSRIVGAALTRELGQPTIVLNRAGAAGNIAMEAVARAAPDGYTLLWASSGYGANPSLYKLSYDPVTGFEPVTLVTQQPFLFVVNPAVPAKTVKEFIAYAKANPGKLNYLSSGVGGIQHLAVELFKSLAGVDLVHIPYKGGSSGHTDLISNQVQMEFGTILSTLPLLKNGQVRLLAVTTATRSPVLPETPTLAEAGVPGYAVSGWYAMFAPAKTPAAIVTKLNRETVAVLQSPDVRQRFAADGSMVVASTPAQLAEHVRQDVAKWAKLVREANIRLDATK